AGTARWLGWAGRSSTTYPVHRGAPDGRSRVPRSVSTGAVRPPGALGRGAVLADQAGGARRPRRAGGVRAGVGGLRAAEAGAARAAERGGVRLRLRTRPDRPAVPRQGHRPLDAA